MKNALPGGTQQFATKQLRRQTAAYGLNKMHKKSEKWVMEFNICMYSFPWKAYDYTKASPNLYIHKTYITNTHLAINKSFKFRIPHIGHTSVHFHCLLCIDTTSHLFKLKYSLTKCWSFLTLKSEAAPTTERKKPATRAMWYLGLNSTAVIMAPSVREA